MKVAITGASGFIGQRLVHALAREGAEIVALTRRRPVKVIPNLHTVHGDLSGAEDSLAQLVRDCDVIYHCAGEVRDRSKMRNIHVDGTRRLLQVVQEEGRRRQAQIHWVQLSSVGAYGPPTRPDEERVITEESPARPVGVYEVTKTLADELVAQAGSDGRITYSIVRPANVFGAAMPNGSLRALGTMVRKGLYFHIGRPGAVAPYVHVDDVAELLRICGSDERARGRTFNVSNDCLLTEMIAGMAMALGVKPPVLRLPEAFVRHAVRLGALAVRVPLTQERIDALVARTRYPSLRAKRELGFIPRRFVPDSIGEVLTG